MCGGKMPQSNTHLNVLDLCRLCLGKENSLTPVFDKLSHKISVCLSVEIKKEDEVSQKICNHCLTKVDSYFDFRNTTLECQKVLHRWANEANQTLSNLDSPEFSSKDTDNEDKEKLITQFNRTSENDESDIDYDSRSGSESSNDERNDNADKELSPLSKSIDSSIDTATLDVREVPGTSGVQPSNDKSSLIELKTRFRQHSFEGSKEETDNKTKSETNVCPNDQDSKKSHTICPTKTAEATTGKEVSKLGIQEKIKDKGYTKKHLECNLCQFTARYKSQLDIHMKRHKKDYKIFCDVCHKGFFYQYEILMHMALHEETNRFQCNVCQKKFVYRHSLISHERKHKEVFKSSETFQCDKCDKKFSDRSYLKRHLDVHNGVNKVVCEVCGQVLCSPGALRSHSLTHTGERPFSCTVCGKSFKSKKYMMIHKRMHTGAKPFKCKVCEKSFSQQSTLIVHNRYHSGERPYQCQVCCKAFVTKTILKVHQKSHTA